MDPVRIVQGTAVPLDRSDVDTDQIIPAHWLKRVERTGFGRGLFSTWRDDRDFVLNDERYAGANVLVAGPNFGTGSSREHAVWAIMDYGFAAVVSPRFGDIFRNNATKNGLVPVLVPAEVGEALLRAVETDPTLEVIVDVERRTLSAPAAGIEAEFEGAFHLAFHVVEMLGREESKALGDHGFQASSNYFTESDTTYNSTPADAITTYETTRPDWLPTA